MIRVGLRNVKIFLLNNSLKQFCIKLHDRRSIVVPVNIKLKKNKIQLIKYISSSLTTTNAFFPNASLAVPITTVRPGRRKHFRWRLRRHFRVRLWWGSWRQQVPGLAPSYSPSLPPRERKKAVKNSVADPGCLSRILIFTHPGSRIQKQQQKRGAKKKFVVLTLYVATNFTKLQIILVLKCWRKNLGQIFKELLNFLPQKLSLSSQKYGFGIRDPEKTYSGSRIQGSKRHRIPDPDPQHWKKVKRPETQIFLSDPDPRIRLICTTDRIPYQ